MCDRVKTGENGSGLHSFFYYITLSFIWVHVAHVFERSFLGCDQNTVKTVIL